MSELIGANFDTQHINGKAEHCSAFGMVHVADTYTRFMLFVMDAGGVSPQRFAELLHAAVVGFNNYPDDPAMYVNPLDEANVFMRVSLETVQENATPDDYIETARAYSQLLAQADGSGD